MIINVLILSAAIFLVSQILPGVRIKGYLTAVVAAVVYSVINFFFRMDFNPAVPAADHHHVRPFQAGDQCIYALDHRQDD